jgi:hypothetical protein
VSASGTGKGTEIGIGIGIAIETDAAKEKKTKKETETETATVNATEIASGPGATTPNPQWTATTKPRKQNEAAATTPDPSQAATKATPEKHERTPPPLHQNHPNPKKTPILLNARPATANACSRNSSGAKQCRQTVTAENRVVAATVARNEVEGG